MLKFNLNEGQSLIFIGLNVRPIVIGSIDYLSLTYSAIEIVTAHWKHPHICHLQINHPSYTQLLIAVLQSVKAGKPLW